MAKILVLYASKYGQTAKVAGLITDELSKIGHDPYLVNVDEGASFTPEAFDGFIVGAPVYSGKYPKRLQNWVNRHCGQLAKRPSAFFSVCLGILETGNPDTQDEERAIVNRLLTACRWHPNLTSIIAGALPYTKYNWFVRLLMKRIAKKAGGDIDTSRDYEYTNWEDVRKFARRFDELISRPAPKPIPFQRAL